MIKTKKIKKLLTAVTATVLGAAFALSAASCAHKHTFSSEWSHDETYHWHQATCSHTEVTRGKAEHDFGTDDVCDTCNYDRSTPSVNPGPNPDNPDNPNPDKPSAKKFTVSFANVDASSYPQIEVEENGFVTGIADPVRTDETFLGWYTDEACTNNFLIGGTPVTQNITLYAKWKPNGGDTPVIAKKYTVTFDSDGGKAVDPQTVEEGKKAFCPITPERAGYQFKGWYLGGVEYSFENVVTKNITLVAHWDVLDVKIKAYGGYNESLYVEWADGAPSQATVQYSAHGANDWHNVDGELIRAKLGANSVARVDVLGITAGSYDVKITPSSGSALELNGVEVTAHDRSGYAHFNRKSTEAAYDGIGAYKDDGTLKDNALVIYVTDENKDTVMSDIDAKYRYNIPNYFTNKWGNKQADGIGWWLNNAQYSKCEKNSSGTAIESKSSNTYDPNGTKLAFASVVADNIPICIRFIGTVTTPEGCTEYNSLNEGGTEGDNGHMARMKDLKNVTIEGVGDDATLDGWGIHFMVGDASNGKGSSFETRNLTFINYPEDAIGMEGASKANAYTDAPVSRCWVHNNTFLPGYASPTTDSDKSEGDGSCDFKRGEYFTLSYNYFDDCHKTNLVGASTSNWQYNITYHHNWWNNAQSRVPLLRNSNVHFYNNYVSVSDSNDYVHGMEGTSYLFSEANYYTNCKQIMRPSKGGYIKAWQNTYYGCYSNAGYPESSGGTQYFFEAETREQSVTNNCKYHDGTSLKNFDTNPSQFYYNAQTGQSDCLLDDSVTARAKVIQYAGVNDWGKNNPKKQGSNVHPVFKTNMISRTPASAVAVPDEGTLTIDLSAAKENGTVSGVLFAASGSSSGIKAKGQIIFFTLAVEAEVTFTAEGKESDNLAELISANGTVYASKASNATVVLPAGTYCISSGSATLTGSNAKEVTVTSLSFKSTAGAAQAKIENLNAAIDAIPDTVTVESGSLITAAKTALSALGADELEAYKTENKARYDKYVAAVAAYEQAQVDDVIAKINAIGTVGEDSYPAIQAARTAYGSLSTAQQSNVTNYSDLTAAEAAWANIAATSVNNSIAALTDVSGWTVETHTKQEISDQKTAYESVKSAYDALTSAQKGTISGYDKVTNGLTKLGALLDEITQAEQQAANLADFTAKLNALTVETVDLTSGSALKTAYDKLTQLQKDALDSADAEKYTAIIAEYNNLVTAQAANTVKVGFGGKTMTTDGTGVTITSSGSYKDYKGSAAVTINGESYNSGLKLQSNAGEIKFTAATDKTLKIYVQSASISVEINGTETEKATQQADGTFVITVEITAGTEYTIKKGNGEANVFLLEFTKPENNA